MKGLGAEDLASTKNCCGGRNIPPDVDVGVTLTSATKLPAPSPAGFSESVVKAGVTLRDCVAVTQLRLLALRKLIDVRKLICEPSRLVMEMFWGGGATVGRVESKVNVTSFGMIKAGAATTFSVTLTEMGGAPGALIVMEPL